MSLPGLSTGHVQTALCVMADGDMVPDRQVCSGKPPPSSKFWQNIAGLGHSIKNLQSLRHLAFGIGKITLGHKLVQKGHFWASSKIYLKKIEL